MEEPEIIEVSSDSDYEVEDNGAIVNDIVANIPNYRTVTIIGPPVPMPHPAFMSWMKNTKLFG